MNFHFEYLLRITTYNTYSMKEPDLYYFEAIKMTSHPIQIHREHSPAPVFSIENYNGLVNVILWLHDSIDQAIS